MMDPLLVAIELQICQALKSRRFSLENEKRLQAEIAYQLYQSKLSFDIEYHLDAHNIIDFFVEGIGIEIKISGSAMNIYRQCERYCRFDAIKFLILITNKYMGLPEEIDGKPCSIINLGEAWL
jgi:hypothetical protein